MEIAINRRKQTLIILLVLIMHFFLLLFFALIQFKAPERQALADVIMQEPKEEHHEQEDEFELKAHDAFGGAPVVFADEPDQVENLQPEPLAKQEQNQEITQPPIEQVEPDEKIQEEKPEPEKKEQKPTVEKQPDATTPLELPAEKQPDVTIAQEIYHKAREIIEKPQMEKPRIKPQPQSTPQTQPTAKKLTMAELAQGFLNHMKEQPEPYTMATLSQNKGAPSTEQLILERYLQKILLCIIKSYQISNNKPNSITQPHEGTIGLLIKKDGTLPDAYIVESSGNRSVDAFLLSIFRDACTAFPPIPQGLKNNQYPISFRFPDIRMFGSAMGWHLTN